MASMNDKLQVDIIEFWKERLCPWCEAHVPNGSGVGTGRISDGIFCSLDHYANFYFGVPKQWGQEGELDQNSTALVSDPTMKSS
jgi:hypothetical protein